MIYRKTTYISLTYQSSNLNQNLMQLILIFHVILLPITAAQSKSINRSIYFTNMKRLNYLCKLKGANDNRQRLNRTSPVLCI